jgi:hypothetical protein
VENFWKWLAGIIVVSILILFGGFMIGSAVHDSKKQGVDLSIECIKAGGNPVTNTNNGSFECRK